MRCAVGDRGALTVGPPAQVLGLQDAGHSATSGGHQLAAVAACGSRGALAACFAPLARALQPEAGRTGVYTVLDGARP